MGLYGSTRANCFRRYRSFKTNIRNRLPRHNLGRTVIFYLNGGMNCKLYLGGN